MSAHTIRQRLQAAFEPELLDLADESHLHIGHAGNTGGGHYRIHIVSPRFAGMSRIERQRAVQAPLHDLYPGQIHALSIRAQTPEEYRS
ncbi:MULTISPECIES: BolA family transcriptional regulator [Eikenella]|uniref:BolA family transcriptional regulator n=1 Tax=Eikenella longinqua TaxID=1795827 RepID=A0A1A9RXD2_9NEIS|nr:MULTISPECIES: BolA family protein [Eikenella]OAM27710.1 BolA family transcriptional regulator [Eikenella longinqua]